MFARAQESAQVDCNGLRTPDRNANLRVKRTPAAISGSHLERGLRCGEPTLVRRHVVARKRVVGPAGEEECLWRARRADVDRQEMRRRKPSNRQQSEVVRIRAIAVRDTRRTSCP